VRKNHRGHKDGKISRKGAKEKQDQNRHKKAQKAQKWNGNEWHKGDKDSHWRMLEGSRPSCTSPEKTDTSVFVFLVDLLLGL
jgi:hypothetical protein